MGMIGRDIRGRQPDNRRPKKRPQWMVGGVTILTFVALLYIVELIDQLTGGIAWTTTASGRWKPTACGASSSRRCCTRTGST